MKSVDIGSSRLGLAGLEGPQSCTEHMSDKTPPPNQSDAERSGVERDWNSKSDRMFARGYAALVITFVGGIGLYLVFSLLTN